MSDQAENLRMQMKHLSRGKPTKVVSIVSGKGGVGKTNFSVNLAIGLRQIGKKVLLMDLDIGMANIDIVAGISAKSTIVDMIENRLSIFEIMTKGPAGVTVIAGGSGLSRLFELDVIKWTYFMRQLERLNHQFDYIIFDMGAGLTKDSQEFILASHELILVVTPEPTSITDGYALVKSIVQKEQHMPFFIIVNSCENEKQGNETAGRFKQAARKFLGKDIVTIGSLPYDRTVRKAVQEQTPFLLSQPNSKISKALKKIVLTYSGEASQTSKKTYGNFLAKLSKWFTPN